MKQRKHRTAAKKKTPIRSALRTDSALQAHVLNGVAALDQAHRGLLDEAVKPQIADSLGLDDALQEAYPQSNRWDYLLGHSPTGDVVALESHTATDGEVSVVIAKREAARLQLRRHLRAGEQPVAWIGVTAGKVGFAQTEKAARRLDQAGITFASRKVLPKHLPPAKSNS